MNPVVDKFVSALFDGRDGLQQPRVLDVGAGDGRYSRYMSARGCVVTAIEPFRELRWDGRLAASHRCSFEDWYAHIGRGREQFDGVLAMNMLQFLSRRDALAKVLPMMMSIIAPGGVLALETFFGEPVPMFEDGFHDGIFSQRELLTAFERAGGGVWEFPPWWELKRERRSDVDGEDKTERLFSFVRLVARRR